MGQLIVTENESSGSKAEEELTIRYWKALQAHLACAGIDLQVWNKEQFTFTILHLTMCGRPMSLLFQDDLDYPLGALRQDLVPALEMTKLLLFDNEL